MGGCLGADKLLANNKGNIKMTGAYLRVLRDGKMVNIEVEYLTDEERREKLAEDPRLIEWLNLVCNTLIEAESVLNQIEQIIRPQSTEG